MEPYRPYVDKVVCGIIRGNGKFLEMTPDNEKRNAKHSGNGCNDRRAEKPDDECGAAHHGIARQVF